MTPLPDVGERKALLAEGLHRAYPLRAPVNIASLLLTIDRAEQWHDQLCTTVSCERAGPIGQRGSAGGAR